MDTSPFDAILWQDGGLEIDDVLFRLIPLSEFRGDPNQEYFRLVKDARLLDEYDIFFKKHWPFEVANLLELGIWQTGSLAFWNLLLRPRMHVAIDIAQRVEPPYFKRYMSERGLADRLKTYWQTDQSDNRTLSRILRRDFNGEPLDMVIDDASHLYEPTKASFAIVMPHLREGGIYIIEDWAWWHDEELRSQHPDSEIGIVPLIDQIRELDEPEIVTSVELMERFLAVTRGPLPPEEAARRLEAKLSPRYAGVPFLKRHARRSRTWKRLRRLLGLPTAYSAP
jgi:hypothetical protein